MRNQRFDSLYIRVKYNTFLYEMIAQMTNTELQDNTILNVSKHRSAIWSTGVGQRLPNDIVGMSHTFPATATRRRSNAANPVRPVAWYACLQHSTLHTQLSRPVRP